MAFPLRRQVSRSTDGSVKWFNQPLSHLRSRYNLLCELYSRYKTNNLLHLRNTTRAIYRKAISEAKINATSSFIENSSNKSCAAWKLINAQRRDRESQCLDLNPDEVNNYFVNMPVTIVRNLTGVRNDHTSVCTIPSNFNMFSLQAVTHNEVREIFRGLKNSPSRDIFGLSVNFIKNNISLYVLPLCKLINTAFKEGIFPDSLKKASVVPVFKSGSKSEVTNYRPISILPVFSKVYERAIYNRIMSHVKKYNILYDNQFGFQGGKCAEDAIIKLTNVCMDTFENGEYCISLFLDLSRAFDCVSHTILIHKLINIYHFDDLSISLIHSYLNGRTQVTRVNNSTSDSLPIVRGVPQGSILGPLLFLLFFNDFAYYIKAGLDNCDCILYADDATVLIRGRNRDDTASGAELALSRARDWCLANELCLNENKTVTLPFTLRQIDAPCPDVTKFLGLYIAAPALRFHEHSVEMGKKVNRNIFLLRRLAVTVTPKVVKSAYFAFVHSILSYSILAWGAAPEAAHMFGLQRRAVRIVTGLGYRDDCRNAFIAQSILTIPSLYILRCVGYILESMNSLRMHGDIHPYETRGREDLYPDFARLCKTQSGPIYMGQKLYNHLPHSVRALPADELLGKLKTFLLKKGFYSIREFLETSVDLFSA